MIVFSVMTTSTPVKMEETTLRLTTTAAAVRTGTAGQAKA
jgi:hypothetical protein